MPSTREERIRRFIAEVTLMLGLAALAYWYYVHGYVGLLLVCGCIVPGILVTATQVRHWTDDVKARSVRGIGLTFAVLIAMFTAFAYWFAWNTSPIERIAGYGGLLRTHQKMTSHFPRTIP